MKPCFIGNVNFAPKIPSKPSVWMLEEPFAQVTSDGYIIICRPFERTDGASIPRLLWPLIGHPFKGSNAFWSQPHDQGYSGKAIVFPVSIVKSIDVKHLIEQTRGSAYMYDELASYAVHMRDRKWWDKKLLEGCKLMGDNIFKRSAVYAGVRSGGWMSFRKE